MTKLITALAALFFTTAACSSEAPPSSNDDDGAGSESSGSSNEIDPTLNTDGDCMTDVEELALGTDPALADSDGDGIDDCAEVACVSNPTDAAEVCYQCGWKHGDPGSIVPTGADTGHVMNDVELIDQCGEPVSLWDFYGAYHILYMTAAW